MKFCVDGPDINISSFRAKYFKRIQRNVRKPGTTKTKTYLNNIFPHLILWWKNSVEFLVDGSPFWMSDVVTNPRYRSVPFVIVTVSTHPRNQPAI